MGKANMLTTLTGLDEYWADSTGRRNTRLLNRF
jgi:hypothetical protein